MRVWKSTMVRAGKIFPGSLVIFLSSILDKAGVNKLNIQFIEARVCAVCFKENSGE